MKRKFVFILISIITVLASCEKDRIISNDQQVGRSKITYYATFTLTGDAVMSLVQGSTFTEPGVKAEAAGQEVPVTTSGSVDADVPGLYTLNYSATNSDGYSASASRIVVVLPEAEEPGIDLSGTYDAVSASAGTAQISKVAPAVYYTTNCWNGATTIPVYFYSTDGASITIPTQSTGFGGIETTHPGTYVNGLITWELDLLDQGPLIRTRAWQKR